jgi:type VI secretion system lysozyme-like protein
MIVAKRSLFYRFDEALSQDDIYLNEKEYIDFIMYEVRTIMNTRCILPKSHQKSHLPLNYGLPFLFGLQEPQDLTNSHQQKEWAKKLQQTIEYFEPRLIHPKVLIMTFNKDRQSLDVEISGYILINKLRKRVQFPLEIQTPY